MTLFNVRFRQMQYCNMRPVYRDDTAAHTVNGFETPRKVTQDANIRQSVYLSFVGTEDYDQFVKFNPNPIVCFFNRKVHCSRITLKIGLKCIVSPEFGMLDEFSTSQRTCKLLHGISCFLVHKLSFFDMDCD